MTIEFNADPKTLDDTDYVPNTYERSDLKFARVPLDPFLKKRGLHLPDVPFYNNSFLAGGFVANLVNGGYSASDIDLFFPSQMALEVQVNALLTGGFKASLCDDDVIDAHCKWLKPGEALDKKAFLQFDGQPRCAEPVQCVKIQYFTDLEHVLDCFDFTVCQFGIDLDKRELVYNPVAPMDWAAKRLVQHRVESTRARVHKRIEKYLNKGFTADRTIVYPEK